MLQYIIILNWEKYDDKELSLNAIIRSVKAIQGKIPNWVRGSMDHRFISTYLIIIIIIKLSYTQIKQLKVNKKKIFIFIMYYNFHNNLKLLSIRKK